MLIGVGSHTRPSRLRPVEGEGSGFQRQIWNDSEGEILPCIDFGVLTALLLDLGVAYRIIGNDKFLEQLCPIGWTFESGRVAQF